MVPENSVAERKVEEWRFYHFKGVHTPLSAFILSSFFRGTAANNLQACQDTETLNESGGLL